MCSRRGSVKGGEREGRAAWFADEDRKEAVLILGKAQKGAVGGMGMYQDRTACAVPVVEEVGGQPMVGEETGAKGGELIKGADASFLECYDLEARGHFRYLLPSGSEAIDVEVVGQISVSVQQQRR